MSEKDKIWELINSMLLRENTVYEEALLNHLRGVSIAVPPSYLIDAFLKGFQQRKPNSTGAAQFLNEMKVSSVMKEKVQDVVKYLIDFEEGE